MAISHSCYIISHEINYAADMLLILYLKAPCGPFTNKF